MPYIPPTGDAVNFSWSGAADYVAPAGNAVDFNWQSGDITEFEVTLNAVLPAITGEIDLYHDNSRLLSIDARAPVPVSGIALWFGYELALASSTPVPSGAINLDWGAAIPSVTLTMENAADSLHRSRWKLATPVDSEWQSAFNEPTSNDADTSVTWSDDGLMVSTVDCTNTVPLAINATNEQCWRWALKYDAGTGMDNKAAHSVDEGALIEWTNFAAHMECEQDARWNWPHPTDELKTEPWQSVDLFGTQLVWDTRDYIPPSGNAVDFSWQDAGYEVPNQNEINFSWGAPSPYTNQPIAPADTGRHITVAIANKLDDELTVNWGAGSWTRPVPDYTTGGSWDVEPEEPAARPPQPQILGTYIFMPTCKLYRTSDGAEIQAINVNWSTNIESWGWQFSATLLRDSDLTLLKPDSNGPHEITCEINGHTFTGMVESYAPTRRFGEAAFTIKGRSLSAWLADPYALKRSKAITARYSAAALAGQEVENTGWTIDWQAPDWIVAAGAWSYENLAPISAIKRLADAVGACIRTEPDAQTLTVLPRYPVSPHLWSDASTTLDAILPAAMVTEYSGNFVKKPNFNRSIVTGGSTGGVIVTLTRYGTAGDIPTDMIQNDLITDSDAGQERGRIEIAKGGAWENMNLTGWLTESGEAPGLLLPGYLVEYQDTDDTAIPVQISSTQINASQQNDGAVSVRQTLGAERYLADVQY